MKRPTVVTVPASFVAYLEEALITSLMDAVEKLGDLGWDPADYAEPLRVFDSYRRLMDALGWEKLDRDADLELDLQGNLTALTRSMQSALGLEQDRMLESDPTDPEHVEAREDAEAIKAFAKSAGLKLGWAEREGATEHAHKAHAKRQRESA